MQSTDTTAFMSELQKAVGGSGVIDNIILARQGVKEAQAIVNQLRSMASSIPVDIYMGFPIPEPQNSQNKAAKQGILDSVIMIENCMVGIKRALNLVPTSNIPKPAAASELLKAYVNLLNEIPKIQDQFNKVSSYGISMPSDFFKAIPQSITLPGANGTVNIVDKSTTFIQINDYVKAVPSQGTVFQTK